MNEDCLISRETACDAVRTEPVAAGKPTPAAPGHKTLPEYLINSILL